MCINQSAFQKLKRPFLFFFSFTNLPKTKFSVFITANIFHHNNDTRSRRGCLFKKKEREKRLLNSYGEPLRGLSWCESSPLTRRWMLCSSLAASFSVQVFGDMETEPDDMLDE